jgi:hypothetical protein
VFYIFEHTFCVHFLNISYACFFDFSRTHTLAASVFIITAYNIIYSKTTYNRTWKKIEWNTSIFSLLCWDLVSLFTFLCCCCIVNMWIIIKKNVQFTFAVSWIMTWILECVTTNNNIHDIFKKSDYLNFIRTIYISVLLHLFFLFHVLS